MFLDFSIYKELNSKITNNVMKTSDPIRKVEIYLNIAFYNNVFNSLNIRPTTWLVFLVLQNIVTSMLIIIIPETKPDIFNCYGLPTWTIFKV